MPGGMVTTTQRHLQEIGKPELFDATLEEVTRVRAEMGYPIMVTPVSQFVATQAVMNVISKERWTKVSSEMVRYFLGHYYEPAAPVAPEVAEKVLSGGRVEKLRELEPLSLDGARERFGEEISDEELLLRLTMPAEQVDEMLSESAARAAR
jgi:oxaloacetate decarboxylase alpha subunit